MGGGGGVGGGFGANSNLACLSLTTSLGCVLLGPVSSLPWGWFWVGVVVGVSLFGLVSWVRLVWSVVGFGWCFVRVFPWLVGCGIGSGLVWLGSCGLVLVLSSVSVSGFSLTVNF